MRACLTVSLALWMATLGVGVASAAAPPDKACAEIAKRHAAGLASVKAAATEDGERAVKPPFPVPSVTPPIGQCWRVPGGGAWGVVLAELVAGVSVYEDDAIELTGAVVAVGVDASGAVRTQRVGDFVAGPSCETQVTARPVTPTSRALLVTVAPSCHEAPMTQSGTLLTWDGQQLVQAPSALPHLPLTADDDVADRVWTSRHGTLQFPGGMDGETAYSLGVPFTIAPDATLTFDAAAHAALTEQCRDRSVAAITNFADIDGGDLTTAIDCDWVRGKDVTAALKRAFKVCGKKPAREPDQSDDDYEMTTDDWALAQPAICSQRDAVKRLFASRPPVRLDQAPVASALPATSVREGSAKVAVAKVEASSAVADYKDYTFVAANLTDGKLDTCWQPRSKRPHKGAWARLTLGGPTSVTAVVIANGFQREDALGDLFAMNDRVASGRLRFDDGPEVPFSLRADTRGRVTVPLDAPRTTRTVTVVIEAAHRGNRWSQVALSEIEVQGAPAP